MTVVVADLALLYVAHKKNRFVWGATAVAGLGLAAVGWTDERGGIPLLLAIGFLFAVKRWKQGVAFFVVALPLYLFSMTLDCA